MNCKKCGNVLEPTDTVCKICGEPVAAAPQVEQPTVAPVATEPVTSAPAPIAPTVQPETSAPVTEAPTVAQAVVEPTAPVTQAPVINPVPSIQETPTVAPTTGTEFSAPAPTADQIVPPVAETGVPVAQPTASPVVETQANAVEPKKSNKTFIILVVILALIILGLGGYLIWNNFIKDDSSDKTETKETEKDKTKDEDDKEDKKEETISSADVITSGGYQFKIPNGYEKVTEDSEEYLVNKTNKTLIITEIFNGYLVSDVKNEFDEELVAELKAACVENETCVEVSNYETTTVNGQEIFYGKIQHSGVMIYQISMNVGTSDAVFYSFYDYTKTANINEIFNTLITMTSSATKNSSFSSEENTTKEEIDFNLPESINYNFE